MPNLASFADELVKLSEDKEEKSSNILGRIMQGSMGATSLAQILPVLKRTAAGRGTFYHGTDAISEILNSPRGVDPEFAGKGVSTEGFGSGNTRGVRINRHLMAESLNRKLEELGHSLSPEEMVNNADLFNLYMDRGMKPSEAAKAAFRESIGLDTTPAESLIGAGKINKEELEKFLKKTDGDVHDAIREMRRKNLKVPDVYDDLSRLRDAAFNKLKRLDPGGDFEKNWRRAYRIAVGLEELPKPPTPVGTGKMTREQAERLVGSIEDDLSRFGKRTYFGVDPSDLSVWTSGKNELGMAADAASALKNHSPKAQAVRQLGAVSNVLLGGLPDQVAAQRKRMGYKPTSQESLTLDEAKKKLSVMKEWWAKAGKGRLPAVLGAHASTDQLGYMEDFPVVRRVMQVHPGSQRVLKDLGVHTFEPGRDLSFPHEVPSKNIFQVDVPLPSGRGFHRINISDAQQVARAGLRSRILKSLPHAGLGALGAYNVYRAIKPRDREKTASVKSDMRHVAKKILPFVGLATAGGVGADYLLNRAMPMDPNATSLTGKAKEETKSVLRTLGATALGSIAPAYLGYRWAKNLPANASVRGAFGKKTGLFGASLGAMLGSMPASIGASGREVIQKDPSADPLLAPLPDSVHRAMKANPTLSGLIYSNLLAGALPMAAVYTARKYYPSAYGKMALNARSMIKGNA